jgi:acetyltransferase-like isoleucine patch superfamily enzyme
MKYKNSIFTKILYFIKLNYRKFLSISGKNNSIIINGLLYNCNKQIHGNNNTFILSKNSVLNNSLIHIIGNSNELIIGENCVIGKDCSFWIDGNRNKIILKNNITFTYGVHLCAQEENTIIEIGDDCMFANTINIRTSDSHPIFDLNNKMRINNAKSVYVGNHVWVSAKATILKGVKVENGAIIGYSSIVTKDIPEKSLAVGTPAKVIKSNILWKRKFD